MDKIDYLLQYAHELQAQVHEAHNTDGPVLDTWGRITKVNNLIEEELSKETLSSN